MKLRYTPGYNRVYIVAEDQATAKEMLLEFMSKITLITTKDTFPFGWVQASVYDTSGLEHYIEASGSNQQVRIGNLARIGLGESVSIESQLPNFDRSFLAMFDTKQMVLLATQKPESIIFTFERARPNDLPRFQAALLAHLPFVKGPFPNLTIIANEQINSDIEATLTACRQLHALNNKKHNLYEANNRIFYRLLLDTLQPFRNDIEALEQHVTKDPLEARNAINAVIHKINSFAASTKGKSLLTINGQVTITNKPGWNTVTVSCISQKEAEILLDFCVNKIETVPLREVSGLNHTVYNNFCINIPSNFFIGIGRVLQSIFCHFPSPQKGKVLEREEKIYRSLENLIAVNIYEPLLPIRYLVDDEQNSTDILAFQIALLRIHESLVSDSFPSLNIEVKLAQDPIKPIINACEKLFKIKQAKSSHLPWSLMYRILETAYSNISKQIQDLEQQYHSKDYSNANTAIAKILTQIHKVDALCVKYDQLGATVSRGNPYNVREVVVLSKIYTGILIALNQNDLDNATELAECYYSNNITRGLQLAAPFTDQIAECEKVLGVLPLKS